MQSRNLNLIKIPVDPAAIFQQITDIHNQKMQLLQARFEKCDLETEEGRDEAAAIESIGRLEIESYQAAIEQKEQIKDLTTKNAVMERLLEMAKEKEKADLQRLKDYGVRVERMKESSHKRSRNERDTNLFNEEMRKAPMPSRRY